MVFGRSNRYLHGVYKDNSLIPTEAVRLAALGLLTEGPRSYAELADEVRRHLGGTVYRTIVPRSVRLSEAPSYGQSIATYSPESRGAQAYRELAEEFLARRDQGADHMAPEASAGDGSDRRSSPTMEAVA